MPSEEVVVRTGAEIGAWRVPARLIMWDPNILRPEDALIADDGRLYVQHYWEGRVKKPGLAVGGRLRIAALVYLAGPLGFPVRTPLSDL
jgi:hypothetical protein